jgi:hypothetical protein
LFVRFGNLSQAEIQARNKTNPNKAKAADKANLPNKTKVPKTVNLSNRAKAPNKTFQQWIRSLGTKRSVTYATVS